MNRVELKHIALRSSRLSGLAPKVHRVLFGLFLLQFTLVWARLWLPWPLLGSARWPDGLLVVLTTATLLASLTRQLPGQNVMLAAVIIACEQGEWFRKRLKPFGNNKVLVFPQPVFFQFYLVIKIGLKRWAAASTTR